MQELGVQLLMLYSAASTQMQSQDKMQKLVLPLLLLCSAASSQVQSQDMRQELHAVCPACQEAQQPAALQVSHQAGNSVVVSQPCNHKYGAESQQVFEPDRST